MLARSYADNTLKTIHYVLFAWACLTQWYRVCHARQQLHISTTGLDIIKSASSLTCPQDLLCDCDRQNNATQETSSWSDDAYLSLSCFMYAKSKGGLDLCAQPSAPVHKQSRLTASSDQRHYRAAIGLPRRMCGVIMRGDLSCNMRFGFDY